MVPRHWSLLALLGLLSGCMATVPPAISDIRHDVVKVQHAPVHDASSLEQVRREAERGCQLYERQVSNQISKRCIAAQPGFFGVPVCVREEYLFACVEHP